MNIQYQLKQAGLHQTEIKIYLYLLEQGLSTPPQIAKGTNIARTNCYNILRELKEKGLITEQTQKKKKVYFASDPEALADNLERKKKAIEQILPDLRAIFTVQKNKPTIKFYDGAEQIKEIYLSTLSSKKIYGLGSTKQMSDLMPEFFIHYQKELKRKEIIFNDILTHSSKIKGAPETKEILKGLYGVKFLPPEYFDQPTDILIWDNNVALITLQEPIFGTVITSNLIAETFKIIFEVMWKEIK